MTTADRITKQQLELLAEAVSNQLTSEICVAVEGRNGYTALDLCDRHGVVRTLTCGKKREVFDYLAGMNASLEIVGR